MDAAKRADLGQWYTPPPVAELTLALTRAMGNTHSGATLVDPCCGDGVFLRAADRLGLRATGFDIDPHAIAQCSVRAPRAQVQCTDLFELDLARVERFDIAVGNPPFVRQQRLEPEQKRRIRAALMADWPDLSPTLIESIVGRGDLAAACLLRTLRLLKPSGIAGFVVSSALLDTDYGRSLWQAMQDCGRVELIIDAPDERWFAEASVHTMIVIFSPRDPVVGPHVGRLRASVSRVLQDFSVTARPAAIADMRAAPLDPGLWSSWLRAPQTYLDYIEHNRCGLVRLSDLAEVRRGITTGANDIFYIRPQRAAELCLEPACLLPLMKSSRKGANRVWFDRAACEYFVLVANGDLRVLPPNVRKYIEANAARAQRYQTLRARKQWWALPHRPARIFLAKAYHDRFVQQCSEMPVLADQRVYTVVPHAGVDHDALAAVLNSSVFALALESVGRSSMGQGALEVSVQDAASVFVPDIRGASGAQRRRLAGAITHMQRPIASIDFELAQSDRQELDAACVALITGVTERQVADALLSAVGQRTARASRVLSSVENSLGPVDRSV